MDRPAILTLVDNTGNSHEVVLTAIRGTSAELSIGGVAVTHPVADIAAMWFGDFTLLWRPPTGSVVSLAVGSRGPAVAWLRNSLAAIDERYASENPQSSVFDAELDELVRSFQRDHRLDIDGVAAGTADGVLGPEEISLDDFDGLVYLMLVAASDLDDTASALRDRLAANYDDRKRLLGL